MHLDHIADDNRPDVLGRARVDDVAGKQFEGLRQFGDLLRHRPHHLVQVGALFGLAIDLEPDRALREVPGLRHLVNGADRSGSIKALADFPGLFFITHGTLQITPRHVQPKRVTIDVRQRLLRRDAAPALADGGYQLSLVVVVLGQCRVGVIGNRAGCDILNGVGRFLKEEGWLTRWVGTHFARMRRVVAANAVDATHRKQFIRANDRDVGRGNGKRCLGLLLRDTRRGATEQGAGADQR